MPLPPAVKFGTPVKITIPSGESKGTHRGILVADDTGICCQWRKVSFRHPELRRTPFVRWEEVAGYEISGHEQGGGRPVTKLRQGTTSLERPWTTLTVKTVDRQLSWRIASGPARVRSSLGDWLAQIDQRVADGTTAASAAPASVADELAKLAELHNAGVLSDDEFSAQKAKLLG